jgi:glycosyltransferase involved in cell wall biosynthesis
VGEVVAGLTAELGTRPALDVIAYALTWRGRSHLEDVVPARVRAATAPLPARFVRASWMRTDHPRIERWTGPVDVVHATNYVPPPSLAPVVVSVYDLGFVRFPELCTADALQYPTLLRRGIARGAVVHTTSDFVADEVRAEFQLPAERVVRVYPGVPRAAGGDAANGPRIAGVARYVLAVGTVEPRKNLPMLVEAFDRLAAIDSDVDLVVAGQDGWGTEEFSAACGRARHSARIRRLGYVSAEERRDLLAGAAVLAYPSRYEGFGFPPLEAMSAGVPVVATRAGAIPETTGDAALLVDPDDPDELAGALFQALDDSELRDELVARGHEQVQRFSWVAAADELVTLDRRVA